MKAILILNNDIYDLTGAVQSITANQDGELKFRGNGIVVHQPSNAIYPKTPIFLSFTGVRVIGGEDVKVYNVVKNWNVMEYAKYDMRASNADLTVILPNFGVKALATAGQIH
ncbi:hypothetical protein VH22019_00079 [Vibrio phage VH2_2019]|nr:hypothetical protein VH22019_00079 [Vibrio phage VH2_2019]